MPALAPSRHRCLVYDGALEASHDVVAPAMRDKLAAGWRCLYLGAPDELASLRTALAALGIDAAGEIARNRLVVSSDRSYLEAGFQPDRMVGMLRCAVEEARADGFAGLFATGDMAWELATEQNLEQLIAYEAKLEQAFAELPALEGICQYNRGSLPARAVRDALLAHRSVYLNATFQPDNLFFVPPEVLLENPGAAARDKQGEWMWLQANRLVKAETERDRARDELGRTNAALDGLVAQRTLALKEAKDEYEAFAYSVAHDLRAPLRAIISFGSMLERKISDALDEEGKELLQRIIKSGRRMDSLILDLLSYSRLNRQDVPLGPVDVDRVVDDVLAALDGELESRSARVEVDHPLPRVIGHAGLLSQALTNLIANAAKFVETGREPRIAIRGERSGRSVRIVIEDNGIGIDEASQSRIFEVFQRLHPADRYPGTGIGLAIVRRACGRMGGQAGVSSIQGKGSRFWIELPEANC